MQVMRHNGESNRQETYHASADEVTAPNQLQMSSQGINARGPTHEPDAVVHVFMLVTDWAGCVILEKSPPGPHSSKPPDHEEHCHAHLRKVIGRSLPNLRERIVEIG